MSVPVWRAAAVITYVAAMRLIRFAAYAVILLSVAGCGGGSIEDEQATALEKAKSQFLTDVDLSSVEVSGGSCSAADEEHEWECGVYGELPEVVRSLVEL